MRKIAQSFRFDWLAHLPSSTNFVQASGSLLRAATRLETDAIVAFPIPAAITLAVLTIRNGTVVFLVMFASSIST